MAGSQGQWIEDDHLVARGEGDHTARRVVHQEEAVQAPEQEAGSNRGCSWLTEKNFIGASYLAPRPLTGHKASYICSPARPVGTSRVWRNW